MEVGNQPLRPAHVPAGDGRGPGGIVMPGCADYEAGLRQGDIIISIDGKAIASFAAFQRFTLVKGMTHKMRVLTQEGKVKDVVITR